MAMRLCSVAIASLLGGTALAAPAAAEAPPRERDCTRWVEPSWPARPPAAPASAASSVPSAFADRAPNPDPMSPVGRRAASLEIVLCEQLNTKDKLDWLIRRLRGS
jgi:hypothetical protein